MNGNYEDDLEAAIRGDTARLQDSEGTFARGMFFGLLFTALLAGLVYLVWQVL